MNNKVVNAPIKFEEIIIVMTKNVIFFSFILSQTVELTIKASAYVSLDEFPPAQSVLLVTNPAQTKAESH